MCGIVGYIGHRQAAEVILHGLSQVEYRGYDSAGMAVSDGRGMRIIKDVGKLRDIHAKHNFLSLEGGIGLGHTRWSTHGPPCERNAHPHYDCSKKVAVVHNGIIENSRALKAELEKKGHKFTSDTDTEIVAHLIEEELKGKKSSSDSILSAVRSSISRLEGAYALGILVSGEPRLFLARRHAPLIIGKGKKEEMFFASDMAALLGYTRDFVLLNEGDLAALDAKGMQIWSADGSPAVRSPLHVDWTPQMAQKMGHDYFMLKEILEQPLTLAAAVSADVADGVKLLAGAKRPAVVACGTSYYAGLVLQYLLHRQKRTASAYLGSEYASWHTGAEDVVVAISQSGETADTLSAVRLAKKEGAKVLAITNVVGSTLSREADATLYISVGPEVGVVATKTFTGQLAVIYKLAYSLSSNKKGLEELAAMPSQVQQMLDEVHEPVHHLAKLMSKRKNFFFISRGIGWPCALEAALKLKEITYLHAEAYAAGELKHGPISMLEDKVPVIAIAPSGALAPKMESNMRECHARGASIIVLSDDKTILSEGEHSLAMPKVSEDFVPLFYILPLQLLAYYMTIELGRDPDQPRNLAKSVTVE
ncbi:Glutamine--fructose-6-phosphate aminotransferase [isomerizing] [uncultured archaeon]|nr:Glutamine--fructose-6-phosphate aminotransferase [isomerizing] [uncultured archaeon]